MGFDYYRFSFYRAYYGNIQGTRAGLNLIGQGPLLQELDMAHWIEHGNYLLSSLQQETRQGCQL